VCGKESTIQTLRLFQSSNIRMFVMLVMTGLMVLQEELKRKETIVVLHNLSTTAGNQARLEVAEEEMEVLLKGLMFRNIRTLTVFLSAPTSMWTKKFAAQMTSMKIKATIRKPYREEDNRRLYLGLHKIRFRIHLQLTKRKEENSLLWARLIRQLLWINLSAVTLQMTRLFWKTVVLI